MIPLRRPLSLCKPPVGKISEVYQITLPRPAMILASVCIGKCIFRGVGNSSNVETAGCNERKGGINAYEIWVDFIGC